MVEIKDMVLLTIEQAAELYNIGQGKLRRMAGEYGCPFSIYIGRKVLIKRKEMDEYLSSKREL